MMGMESEAEQLDGQPLILEVQGLETQVHSKQGISRVVDGVSFKLRRGQTLGLVGESGSGKSMTALSIVGMHPRPAAQITGGRVVFGGVDLMRLTADELRRLRGSKIAFVLQDPMSALNPVMRLGYQVEEPLKAHLNLGGRALKERVLQLLNLLHIPDPQARRRAYPHQLSGGMRQRVVSAVALSCQPSLLIADEPTTALDVTLQAAYLSLLKDIQRREQLSILFITHDFGVVAQMCDSVAVMYAGRIVESGPTKAILEAPVHPYTRALIRSVPRLSEPTKRLVSIRGHPPTPVQQPSGCPFHPRCDLYQSLGEPDRCRAEIPVNEALSPQHEVACHFADTTLFASESTKR